MDDFNLTQNANLAQSNELNLTGGLKHAQVQQLAEAWFPEIRFYQNERFHPIDLELLFTAPPAVFATLPEPAKDSYRIPGTGPFGPARFDPPVIKKGSQIIGHGPTAAEALPDVVFGKDSAYVYTHGKNLRASREFFGATTTVSGAPEPAPGDPRVPRHPIVVRAELRYLLETLKHDLQQHRPDDALWGRFAVQRAFFRAPQQQNILFPDDEMRAVLLKLLNAYKDHNETAFQDALHHDIPPGWEFVQRAWDALTGYVFLEYYFVYAYNDYPEYGTWPWVNEHEGDIEGCCVVFERQALERFAHGDPLDQVVAHTVITSVHEEFNGIDELNRLPVDRETALHDNVVWVAAGSHATYLTGGTHDVYDFETILFDLPSQLPDWVWPLIGLTGLLPELIALLIIAGIEEHFVDSVDETSDSGAKVGPGPPPQPGGTRFNKRIIVTPLSKINDPDRDLNLYQAALSHPPASPEVTLAELARRAFPGKWGADDGIRDHSGPWENKTARYFYKFLSNGEIRSQVIL